MGSKAWTRPCAGNRRPISRGPGRSARCFGAMEKAREHGRCTESRSWGWVRERSRAMPDRASAGRFTRSMPRWSGSPAIRGSSPSYADCPADSVDIILGDARQRLRDAPDHAYQMIVLDAFSSDAVPVHLLSREAIGSIAPSLPRAG